ncbi:tRNA CCA-pyrophosphorylase [Buchnera aphidicola (Thelaxes californica)]|uniref:CCA-adding enzyme n=1 Tax=Buchnera aphidicola (Thelaxes californica) TaxID=1315998 RepID=A0A4D6YA17_9GAMM|nr:tRNA CCA-pyrophosphorylase [Buchnera aphidicola]QCI26607.1 tRNA CCA-pyrophosphorylase [Buchnera aphidicola (Thelaxes californica)]
MKIYLVGGAVRNFLLGLSITDNDWVVVGATPDYFLRRKYKKVGKQFPVFLHPTTNEEYALARTEKKSGLGYGGFSVNFSSSITLKEDLYRRDLTINAIARDEKNNFLDPFNGRQDLNLRVLRHISPAFSEDPLRILRVARFLAEFFHMGFIIAQETFKLICYMVETKELVYLEPYRIWKETEKAMKTKNPHVYFMTLQRCCAVNHLFPELYMLWNHSFLYYKNFIKDNFFLRNLALISQISNKIEIRFASLFQIQHISLLNNHLIKKDFNNKNYIFILKKFFKRLCFPIYVRNLSLFVFKYHYFIMNIQYQSSQDILNFFYSIGAWRNPKIINSFCILMKIYLKNFMNYFETRNQISIVDIGFLRKSFCIAQSVSISKILDEGFRGKQISDELFKRRVYVLQKWRSKY